MRYAIANNNGNNCYADLLDGCQHSRLKAALSGHLTPPAAYQIRRPLVPTQPPVMISDATKAYLWVTGMSVVSLLGVLVTGTINA